MASTPVVVFAPSRQTLTLKLYPQASDTLANGAGDTLTESTNRLGRYAATVTEAITGDHVAVIKVGAAVLGNGWVLDLADTTTEQYVQDAVPGAELTAASVADAVWDELVAAHQAAGSFGALFQVASSSASSNADIKYLTRGDSYDGVTGGNAKLTWTVAGDYQSGWTGTMTIRHRVTAAALAAVTVTASDATTLEATLTVSDTAFALLVTDDEFGPHPYDVEMDNATNQITVVPNGIAVIRKDRTT